LEVDHFAVGVLMDQGAELVWFFDLRKLFASCPGSCLHCVLMCLDGLVSNLFSSLVCRTESHQHCRIRSRAMALPDPIESIIRQIEDDTLGIVAGGDMLEKTFRTMGLLHDMNIHPSQVGFDPVNRDGEGGNSQEVLLLASDIAFVGWSWPETKHALCVQVIPGDLKVEKFNRVLSEGADVELAPVEEDSIHFGSLSCGHTNYGLRCIAAGVASVCPLLSEGGRMSVTKLAARDPEYAAAVTRGLHWKVLHYSVRTKYPKTLSILQSARNVSGQIQRKESEMQGLLRLHGMASAAQAAGQEPDWCGIKRAVLRSRPPFADRLDDMISFLATRSGGVGGSFLQFLAAFHRQFVNPSVRASVASGLYGALAEFPHHYVALALLETAFTCPIEAVKQGVCSWVSSAEVTALARNSEPAVQDRLRAGEVALAEARLRLPQAGFPEPIVNYNKLVAVLSKLDINMGRFLLGKQMSSKKAFESVEAVMQQFTSDLVGQFPQAQLQDYLQLWPLGLPPGGTPATLTVNAIELYAVDAAGKTVHPRALLREKGFEVGAAVAARGTEDLYVIRGVSETSAWPVLVSLLPYGDSDASGYVSTVGLEDFLAGWALANPKARVEQHPGWPLHRTVSTSAAQTLFKKGSVLACLGHLASEVESKFDPVRKVTVLSKPVRKVIAAIDCDVGTIVLGPDSTNVKAVPRNDLGFEPGSSIEATFTPVDATTRFFLAPCTAADNISPLWCVGTTEDESKANLVWGKCLVQSLTAADFIGPPMPRMVSAPAATASVSASAAAAPVSAPKATAKAGKTKAAAPPKATPKAAAKAEAARKRKAEAENLDDLDDDQDASETWVNFPVLLNRFPVKAGEELVVFKPAGVRAREETGPAAITIAKLAAAGKRGRN
jgi:hypothetical protein